jgi:NOL1/NOP2/fmu family ribosome biogenesis protein
MNMSAIQELQKWYYSQCDGDWEHDFGVCIDTLDNPGWRVRIQLQGTLLEGKPFEAIELRMEHERDWMSCKVEDAKFQGHGGPLMLEEIIRAFLSWANAPSKT